MKKPRICFIGLGNLPALTDEFGHLRVGGAQVQQTLLAKALSRRGYPISMIVYDHGQPDGATWDGIRTYKAYAPDTGIPVFRFVHPRWSGLTAAIRRADPDICYMSCAGAEVGQIVLTESRKRRTIFWVASDADCDPSRLLIQYRRDRELYRYGLRRVDAIIAQSDQQQAALAANYGVTSTVMGSFVQTPDNLLDLADRDIHALWVSNIYPLKRPDILLELANRMPESAFQMVGGEVPGHEPMFAEIQAGADALANLEFRGHVPYQKVPEAFRRARVFVNTSDIEGFPNTYLQAWAHGTPVVAFFDPDGVITREGLGRAVRSVEEMEAAIDEFVSNPRLWQDVSTRCLHYMAREYSEDRIIAPYVSLFDRLGGRPHRTQGLAGDLR